MLRTASPNISVITNFGCRADCWYCIWKRHKLQHTNPPTDWDKLEAFLYEHRAKGKVSVSGGGDCLYRYDNHAGWWHRFFTVTNRLGLLVDVHTREKFERDEFWRPRINRCVFSSDNLCDDASYLQYLRRLTQVRITHLVTANTTVDMIEDYIGFSDRVGCQFTIKQLVGFDDNGMYKGVRALYPGLYHLDAGDYNIYYMPDNTVTESFIQGELK